MTLTQQIATRLEALVTADANRCRHGTWEACLRRALEEAGARIVSEAPLLERAMPAGRRPKR